MYPILNGIRIIDLTTIVLGPYATQILGDFGADVIKIESLSGDLFRAARPGRSTYMGAGFLNCNRNKRSLTVNLKTSEGQTIFRRLIQTADAVVHNMRSSTATRLGASYDALKAIRPDIVYCSAPGYGHEGPRADDPAYDDIIQAASGVAALNRDASGHPRFVPSILCDKITGLHLALAVFAGLMHRERTGTGCAIEAPMFESMVSFLMIEALSGESFIPPLGDMGYDRLMSPHRKPFRTADGYIGLLPYSTRHWTRFLTLIGQPETAEADWVTDPVKRSEHIDRLYAIIESVTPTRTTADWCATLKEADIPCTPVNDLEDLLSDPHLQEVGLFEEVDHPSEGRLRTTRSPFSMQGIASHPDQPAPNLSEHSEELLNELGFSDEQVQAFIEKGVVR